MQEIVVTRALMIGMILVGLMMADGRLAGNLFVKLLENGVVLRVLVIDELFQAVRHLGLIR